MVDATIKQLVLHRLEQAQTALADAGYLLEGRRGPQGVINRAYYAMFYAVLALLQLIGKTPSKHAGAVSLFDTEFVLKGVFAKELSRDLHRAFELRQASDYQVTWRINPEMAGEVVLKAERFVEAVRKMLEKSLNE